MRQLLTFIFSTCAFIGMLLPWKVVGNLYNVIGMKAGFGWIIFIVLMLVMILSLLRTIRKENGYKNVYVFAGGLSLMNGILYWFLLSIFPQNHASGNPALEKILQVNGPLEATHGTGVWLTILFSLGIIVVNLVVQDKARFTTVPPVPGNLSTIDIPPTPIQNNPDATA